MRAPRLTLLDRAPAGSTLARRTPTHPTRTRRVPAAPALAVVTAAVLLVGGCSSDTSSSPDPSSSPSAPASGSTSAEPSSDADADADADDATREATPAGTAIAVRIQDGTVEPNGERIKVGVGERVTLSIQADTAGEIHVHSTPEQELEFPAGTSTRSITLDTPGIVEVEDHALERVIVQLEVS